VPRLTGVLRGLSAQQVEVSISELAVKRQAALKQRRAAPLPAPSAAARLLGDYTAAPRAARDAYDAFVAAVAALLDAPLPSDELSGYVEAAWDALRMCAPPPPQRGLAPRDYSAASTALEPLLGSRPKAEPVARLWGAFEHLRGARDQHGLGGERLSAEVRPAGAAKRVREWGDDLGFKASTALVSPEAAMLALCKISEWQPRVDASGADAAGAGAGPSSALASGLAGAGRGAQPSGSRYGVADFGAEDSDDELDAPKKLQRTASLTWLQTTLGAITGARCAAGHTFLGRTGRVTLFRAQGYRRRRRAVTTRCC